MKKQSQNQQLQQQQYIDITKNAPTGINLQGAGLGASLNILGQTIVARDLMNKVVQKIKGVLNANGVHTIKVGPISKSNAIGLNISSSPGIIEIDAQKIINQFKNALPPTIQLDGAQVDPQIEKGEVERISNEIIAQLGNTASHQANHEKQNQQLFLQGKPFTLNQESQAQSFGDKVQNQYFQRAASIKNWYDKAK